MKENDENKTFTLYLKESTYDLLINDRILFMKEKKISTFIKTILCNHYETYNYFLEKLDNNILNTINNFKIDDIKGDLHYHIITNLYKYLNSINTHADLHKKEKKKKLHIRQSNDDRILDFVIDSIPSYTGQSTYFENIICSYLNLPAYEREKILYKDIVLKLNKAIRENKSVKIITNTKKHKKPVIKKIHVIQPKEILPSKEEIYNYLLFQEFNTDKKVYEAKSIHICNILDVEIRRDSNHFSSEIISFFNRMKKNGVQYSINSNTTYKVKFTDKGLDLFELKYLERPIAFNVDQKNHTKEFDCSELQFKNYFSSFNNEIKLLETISNIT